MKDVTIFVLLFLLVGGIISFYQTSKEIRKETKRQNEVCFPYQYSGYVWERKTQVTHDTCYTQDGGITIK